MCAAKAGGRDDLTARARIRDAALRLFGRDGYAATSLRAVAKEAGVSPALVVHHFGGKQGLKRACDEHVARELVDVEVAASQADLVGTMRRWLAEPDAFRAEFDYTARMILEGSETADSLFDALVERTEELLVEGAEAGQMNAFGDVRGAAVVVALIGLAPLVLGRQVARALGERELTAAAVQRLALPAMELLTHGLYRTSELLDATRAAMEAVSRARPQGRPEGEDG